MNAEQGEEGPLISLIIPCYNAAATIGSCLEAAVASDYGSFEIVVVDDRSEDDSVDIVKQHPVRLIPLAEHRGAAGARNAGAEAAGGEALFFLDADCVMQPDTLSRAARAFREHPGAVVGGSYTPRSCDGGFFADFQSVYIHYSETKRREPDYVATHAMLIQKDQFLRNNGFREDFHPILEDVEFSHRLRENGVPLVMDPGILVGHIFRFNLWRSLKNAFRKSRYWTMYSIENRDLARDSGTASLGLKANALSWLVSILLLLLFAASGKLSLLITLLAVCGLNLLINGGFLAALYRAGGAGFATGGLLYYTALYPLPVCTGALVALMRKT
jgi:GT2 family glycosyltransferase